MIAFQFVGIAACFLFIAWSVSKLRGRQRPGWLWLLGIVLGAAGALAIYDPDLTTRAARAVGIGRGADLLIYLVALAFLGSWFYFYQRLRALSAALTAVVRELALRDPKEGAARDGNDRSTGV